MLNLTHHNYKLLSLQLIKAGKFSLIESISQRLIAWTEIATNILWQEIRLCSSVECGRYAKSNFTFDVPQFNVQNEYVSDGQFDYQIYQIIYRQPKTFLWLERSQTIDISNILPQTTKWINRFSCHFKFTVVRIWCYSKFSRRFLLTFLESNIKKRVCLCDSNSIPKTCNIKFNESASLLTAANIKLILVISIVSMTCVVWYTKMKRYTDEKKVTQQLDDGDDLWSIKSTFKRTEKKNT